MGLGFIVGLSLMLVSAFAAIVLGRNLTRSIVAGFVFTAALGWTLQLAGAGFLAFVVAILAVLELTTLQLFGWMLVDVDRDHLPPTDRPTWFARLLAFLLVGGGLALLVATALSTGEFTAGVDRIRIASPTQIGAFLFERLPDATILMGLVIAASLLAVLLLLRDDGEKA